MIAAQAAARAHLKAIEHDRHSREESLRRSQLILADGSEREDVEHIEEKAVIVPKHLLGVPLRDRDYECEEQEAQVRIDKDFSRFTFASYETIRDIALKWRSHSQAMYILCLTRLGRRSLLAYIYT